MEKDKVITAHYRNFTLTVRLLGHTAVSNDLHSPYLEFILVCYLGCLTSNACHRGKSARFIHKKHECIQEPVTKILLKFKTES